MNITKLYNKQYDTGQTVTLATINFSIEPTEEKQPEQEQEQVHIVDQIGQEYVTGPSNPKTFQVFQ